MKFIFENLRRLPVGCPIYLNYNLNTGEVEVRYVVEGEKWVLGPVGTTKAGYRYLHKLLVFSGRTVKTGPITEKH
jgi:hypothetical protein